jgi:hypothetical protein
MRNKPSHYILVMKCRHDEVARVSFLLFFSRPFVSSTSPPRFVLNVRSLTCYTPSTTGIETDRSTCSHLTCIVHNNRLCYGIKHLYNVQYTTCFCWRDTGLDRARTRFAVSRVVVALKKLIARKCSRALCETI